MERTKYAAASPPLSLPPNANEGSAFREEEVDEGGRGSVGE